MMFPCVSIAPLENIVIWKAALCVLIVKLGYLAMQVLKVVHFVILEEFLELGRVAAPHVQEVTRFTYIV